MISSPSRLGKETTIAALQKQLYRNSQTPLHYAQIFFRQYTYGQFTECHFRVHGVRPWL